MSLCVSVSAWVWPHVPWYGCGCMCGFGCMCGCGCKYGCGCRYVCGWLFTGRCGGESAVSGCSREFGYIGMDGGGILGELVVN